MGALEVEAPLLGHTEPRVFTPPLRELTPETSLGFEVIDFAENVLGLELRPWQRWLFIHALELDPETDDFRFKTVVVEVARQNGKTLIMMILGLWRLYVEGASEIISAAQSLNVAEQTLQSSFQMAKRIPVLAKYLPTVRRRGETVAYMRRANGSNMIELARVPEGLEHVLDVDGAMPTWYVVPTNSGGGRSYSADLALLDELREHKNFDTVDAIEPTIMERPRSQIWAFSNAGDASARVLRKWRNIAVSAITRGTSERERMALFSWSAPEGCSIFDRDGWAAANPSLGYGHRTERDMWAMASKAVDPTDDESDESGFRTEYLCQWVQSLEPGVFPEDAIAGAADAGSAPGEGERIVLALDVTWDRSRAHLAIAARRSDGLVHIEEVANRAGTDWLADWLTERLPKNDPQSWWDGRLVIQARGAPASSMIDDLEELGVEVTRWGGPDLAGWTGQFFDALVQGRIKHTGHQPGLVASLRAAKAKWSQAAFWIDRRGSAGDASGAISAVGAVGAVLSPVEETPKSAYEDPDYELMVL